jgi:hypothetical protein
MSILTLQIGQCGNQIGREFFNDMCGEIEISSEALQQKIVQTFFQENLYSK